MIQSDYQTTGHTDGSCSIPAPFVVAKGSYRPKENREPFDLLDELYKFLFLFLQTGFGSVWFGYCMLLCCCLVGWFVCCFFSLIILIHVIIRLCVNLVLCVFVDLFDSCFFCVWRGVWSWTMWSVASVDCMTCFFFAETLGQSMSLCEISTAHRSSKKQEMWEEHDTLSACYVSNRIHVYGIFTYIWLSLMVVSNGKIWLM